MNKKEFNTLVQGLRGLYGADKFPEMTEFTIEVWYEALKDLDFQRTKMAVVNHTKSCKFPPTVADIREQYNELLRGDKDYNSELMDVFYETRNYYPGEDKNASDVFFHYVCKEQDLDKRLLYAKKIRDNVTDYVRKCENGEDEFNKTLSECIKWVVNR